MDSTPSLGDRVCVVSRIAGSIAIAYDLWVVLVLYQERRSYCEVPLRRWLWLALLLGVPVNILVDRASKRHEFKRAFIFECLGMLLSIALLAHGTLLITLTTGEVCPASSPLTWKTVFLSLAVAWSLVTVVSAGLVLSAAVGFMRCQQTH